jgi:thiol-disulfide isomerase/thioredoxin
MRYVLSTLLALALILAAAAAPALAPEGTRLPELALPDLGGQEHQLAELAEDKVAVFVYWSLTCPVCRQEMPHLATLAKRLEGNPFVMVTVNADGPAMRQAAARYVERFELPRPALLDHGPDDSMPFGQRLDVIATPTILVFDRSGKLVHSQELTADLEALRQAIGGAF